MDGMNRLKLAVMAAAFVGGIASAHAQGVVSEWSTVELPEAPVLTAVTIDPATTALMVMDFGSNCDPGGRRPRCAEAMPVISGLLDRAREAGLTIYFTGNQLTPALTRLETEEQINGMGPDKFNGSDLDAKLKAKGITTLLLMGTAPNGAVLFTAFRAAQLGYKLVVPVETMPGNTPYSEQATIWNIANSPGLGEDNATLTSVDTITFGAAQ